MDNKGKDQEQSKAQQDSDPSKKRAKKQEQPLKNHGIPQDPEESRNGGLAGAENFKRNMGCGG